MVLFMNFRLHLYSRIFPLSYSPFLHLGFVALDLTYSSYLHLFGFLGTSSFVMCHKLAGIAGKKEDLENVVPELC